MPFEMIHAQLIKKYFPSEPELKKIRSKVDKFLKKVKHEIDKNQIKASIKIGGSFAKGTFIKDDYDCDIFIRFDYNYTDENISGLLEKILSPYNPKKVHGSRDYFQIKKYGVKFEIIPVLWINNPNEALNVTDCSPLHVDWIQSKLITNPNLSKEIIIAKLFTKSIGVYGAESYINGFSGHVLDILIVNYGSFIELAKNSISWKIKTTIDVEKHGSRLNKNKVLGPLIVIDPIQKERNAAAALSLEKFKLFQKRAKEFLEKPDMKFFIRKDFSLLRIKNNDVVIKIKPLDGKEDIVGCKLLKVYEFMKNALKDFDVSKSGWYWDKGSVCYLWYSVRQKSIDSEYVHIGPPNKSKDHYMKFIEKYPDYYLSDGRAYVKLKREFSDLRPYIKNQIKDNYIKERIDKIKLC